MTHPIKMSRVWPAISSQLKNTTNCCFRLSKPAPLSHWSIRYYPVFRAFIAGVCPQRISRSQQAHTLLDKGLHYREKHVNMS